MILIFGDLSSLYPDSASLLRHAVHQVVSLLAQSEEPRRTTREREGEPKNEGRNEGAKELPRKKAVNNAANNGGRHEMCIRVGRAAQRLGSAILSRKSA